MPAQAFETCCRALQCSMPVAPAHSTKTKCHLIAACQFVSVGLCSFCFIFCCFAFVVLLFFNIFSNSNVVFWHFWSDAAIQHAKHTPSMPRSVPSTSDPAYNPKLIPQVPNCKLDQ
eukprot:gnl/MRDRNA2_/MRDRNA2_80157_c0_seq1.p1 gnl/MRDRNA2_/MRDRNA2_80157_c0~~gnl/MRDRNA2_/MRDRNA2_80157_c0_seq1.p1  ORF type:complete len:116 (+),score=1.92 gnl/MRDRNA2_/MRDRNA2_80157_c0_seq1:26-373(+)